jgi:flagellar hook assembly protein FlgD
MANPEIQPMLDSIGFVYDPTDVQTQSDLATMDFTLNGNYPNPFNPTTTISFNIPAIQKINVIIYDLLGREVKTLFNGEVTPGTINLSWDGKSNQNISVGSGVYIYKIVSKNKLLTGKMVLQK